MMSQELLSGVFSGVVAQVGRGRIEGGWSYVWVSYGLTWAVMAFYGLSLWLRSRSAGETEDGNS